MFQRSHSHSWLGPHGVVMSLISYIAVPLISSPLQLFYTAEQAAYYIIKQEYIPKCIVLEFQSIYQSTKLIKAFLILNQMGNSG